MQIILRELGNVPALGEPRWLVIRGANRSMAASALPDGYVLVVLLRAARGLHALDARAEGLHARARARSRLDDPLIAKSDGAKRRSWFFTKVETDRRGRPTMRRRERRMSVEVIGAVMGLSVRERGFRLRTAAGGELTRVREPRARWYADEPV